MSLPITSLLPALGAAPAEPRAAGPQARLQDASQDPSQAWANALAQATAAATPDGRAAMPARSAQRVAMTSGDKSTTPADPGAAAETPPPPGGTGLVPITGLDDQASIVAELTLQNMPQVPTDAVTTLTAPEQDQGATGTGRGATAPLPLPQAPPLRQPAADSRSAPPDASETAQDGSGWETAAATPAPWLPGNGARSGQSATSHKDERRHHAQALDISGPAVLPDPTVVPSSVTPSSGLDARVAAVAMAAPVPPDPTPTGAPPAPSDGRVAALATIPGPLARTPALPAPRPTPPPILTRADTRTEATIGPGATDPSTMIPKPAAAAPAQTAPAGGRRATRSPDIAPAPVAGSLAPAVPVSAEPPNRSLLDRAQDAVAPSVTIRTPGGDLPIAAQSGRVQTPLPSEQSLPPAPAEVPGNVSGDRAKAAAVLPDRSAPPPRPDAAAPAALPNRGPVLLHPLAAQAASDLRSAAQAGRVQTSLPSGQALAPAPLEVSSHASGDRLTVDGTPPDRPASAPRTVATAPAGLSTTGTPLAHQLADPSAGPSVPDTRDTRDTRGAVIGDSLPPGKAASVASSPVRTSEGAVPAINLAAAQPARAGADTSLASGRGLFADDPAPPVTAATAADPAALASVTAGIGGNTQLPGTSSTAAPAQPFMPSQAHAIPATATALAASVVAMSQSGQSTSVLRLDPPGLGALSIHIALTTSATVNVVFVPSVPQTAQLIHSALPDLHHAMASAGLSLGEAQVGGGAGNGAGGNANGQARNQTGDGNRVVQTTILSRTASEAGPALAKEALRGARAVA